MQLTSGLAQTTSEHVGEQRQAVEAYLSFGHISEALSLLVPLLETSGIPYPTTPGALLLSLARTIFDVRRRTLLRASNRSRVVMSIRRGSARGGMAPGHNTRLRTR